MKTCPYCGAEYPDDCERCPVDNELLPGDEPRPAPAPAEESVPAAPAPMRLTDKQTRLIELALVSVIAFGPSILESFHYFAGYYPVTPDPGEFKWVYGMLRQVSCLGLLWYVLRRNGRTFHDLGLGWARSDLGWSVLLKVAGTAAFYAVYHAIYFAERIRIVNPTPDINVGYYLFGNSVVFAALLFQFVNPFFEELIVRAYVMTEVKQLTRSTGKAIFVSTALQTSYHFYQGGPAALGHAATFLIFSIYYAKTHRITPVILAHLYSDVGFTLFYLGQH